MLPKIKLCVKVNQLGGGVFCVNQVWRSVRLPDKACSEFMGVCAIYKHFSGFGFFLLSSKIHTRAHAVFR